MKHDTKNLFTRYIILEFILILAFLIFDNHSNSIYVSAQSPENNFLTYSNTQQGIKIDYPSDWQKLEDGLFSQVSENHIVSFFSPDMSVSVVLTKGNRENNKTLEEDTKDMITRFKKDYPGFQVSELKKTTLSGIEAYKLVGSGTLSFENLTKNIKMNTENIFGPDAGPFMEKVSTLLPVNIISVWTFKDGQEYGVSYANFPSLSDERFSTYLPVATQIIESFEFTDTVGEGEKTLKTSSEDDNAVQTLKERLARGEITIDQYKELLEIIES